MSNKHVEGTLPEFDIRRAFVDGARWWEYRQTGATMFQSDRNIAEAEAEKRYQDVSRALANGIAVKVCEILNIDPSQKMIEKLVDAVEAALIGDAPTED